MPKSSVTVDLINQFVGRHPKVAFDSNVLIALIEGKRDYTDQAKFVFEAFATHKSEVWTSVITIPEVLLKPLRESPGLVAKEYEHFLFDSPFLFASVELSTARSAALIGARYNLKAGDALVIASLVAVGVTGFITADLGLQRVQEPEILVI